MPLENVYTTAYPNLEPLLNMIRGADGKGLYDFRRLFVPTGQTSVVNTISLPAKLCYITIYNLLEASVIIQENELGAIIAGLLPYTVITLPLPCPMASVSLTAVTDGLNDYSIPYIISNERSSFTNFCARIPPVSDTHIVIQNQEIFALSSQTWIAGQLTKTYPITTFPTGDTIMIYVENNTVKDMVVTFQMEAVLGQFTNWYDGAGTIVQFTVLASTKGIIGPIQKFPRFLSGQITLTAAVAPGAGTTKVSIWEG